MAKERKNSQEEENFKIKQEITEQNPQTMSTQFESCKMNSNSISENYYRKKLIHSANNFLPVLKRAVTDVSVDPMNLSQVISSSCCPTLCPFLHYLSLHEAELHTPAGTEVEMP